MDNEAKPDVCPEFRMHDSDAMNEDTLAVEAHVKQATVSTAVSPDNGLSATDRLCCSDDHLFVQNVKCENEQQEAKNEDSVHRQKIPVMFTMSNQKPCKEILCTLNNAVVVMLACTKL